MSGAVRLHQLIARTVRSSSFLRSGEIPKQSHQLLQQQCRTRTEVIRRTLAAQATAAIHDAEQAKTQTAPNEIGRNRRNQVSTSNGRQQSISRDRFSRSNGGGTTSGADFDRALNKMDVDVKRAGRVSLLDFSSRLEDIKSLGVVHKLTELTTYNSQYSD